MVVKKKRKVALRSLSSDDSDSNGLGCGLIILMLAAALSVMAVLYTLFAKYISYQNTKDVYSIENYQQLISRAEYYTKMYKNISFSNELRHNLPSLSSLRGSSTSLSSISSILPHSYPDKDVVIGIAHNIDVKNLAVFCSSALSVMKTDKVDIVMFVSTPISLKTREVLTKNNIQMIEYSMTQTIEEKFRGYHPSTVRWILIQQFLASKQSIYHRVLLADVRDTYFQLNPFDTVPLTSDRRGSYFYTFQGTDSLTISQCGWNGGWVRDCFGREMLDEIGKNMIVAVGISLGTMENVVKYVDYMNGIISGAPSPETADVVKSLHSKFPSCERNGIDQGVHNVVVHKNLIPNLKIIPLSESMVANLQAKKAVVNEQDFTVTNLKGVKVSIVHQYDRDQALQQYLFKKYVDWTEVSETDSHWNEEQNCKRFKKEDDRDLFKGVCDFRSQGGASSAATCCNICEEFKKHCKAFTFSDSVCYLKSCGIESITGKGVIMEGAVSGYRH